MKKFILSIVCLIFGAILTAQTPAAFKYQAVARDATGAVLANKEVSFQISILAGSVTGTTVFREVHVVATNDFGLVNLDIGTGTKITGDLATVDWGGNDHFIRIEMDPAGGTSYNLMGTSQLLSVPYALHARTVEVDLVEDADADPENELQELALEGDSLALNPHGGKVKLPAGGSLWTKNGDHIFYNTGKVGIGRDPGADLRQFQVLGGSNIAVAAENSTSSYATIYAKNEASTGLAAQFENNSGPVARFGRNIVISDGTQGDGKVLTSDANGVTSWQAPSTGPWQASGSNLYYENGWVGIGTSTITTPLAIANSSNTCYIQLKDNQGADGMRMGAYVGGLALINDNLDKNISFVAKNSSGWNHIMTLVGASNRVGINMMDPPYAVSISGGSIADLSLHSAGTGITANDGLRIGISNTSNAWVWNNESGALYFGTNNQERMRIDGDGNVGIGDSSPDAKLDVNGTMTVGSSGFVFSDIREITGTTGTGDHITIPYPSGYNQGNTRVLSLEINYLGSSWIGLGGNQQNTEINERVFYYLGSTIWIYYPPVADFRNKSFRMLVMKAGS